MWTQILSVTARQGSPKSQQDHFLQLGNAYFTLVPHLSDIWRCKILGCADSRQDINLWVQKIADNAISGVCAVEQRATKHEPKSYSEYLPMESISILGQYLEPVNIKYPAENINILVWWK